MKTIKIIFIAFTCTIILIGCDNPFTTNSTNCREGIIDGHFDELTFDGNVNINDTLKMTFDYGFPSRTELFGEYQIKGDTLIIQNRFKDCSNPNDTNPLDQMSEPIVLNVVFETIGTYYIIVNDSLLSNMIVEVKN